MIEVLPAPDHVMALRVVGKLTGNDCDQLFDELNARLKRHEQVGLYTDATELRGITAAAFAKDLRYGLARLGELHRIPREAIVTDKRWLRTLSRLSDAALPQIEVRAFEQGEREAALAWVADVPDRARKPALREIATTRPGVFAFAVNGKISAEEIGELVRDLKPAVERYEKVRLLGRIERFGGVVPGALADSGLLLLKRALLRKVERYAIVGGAPWMKRYAQVARSLSGIDLRHFAASAESDAWAWLEAEPAAQVQPIPMRSLD